MHITTLLFSARCGAFLVLVAACSSGPGTAPAGAGDGTVRFGVMNELDAPVTIAIDGTVSLIVSGGRASNLAVSPSAQWLTWTSAKPTDSTGTPIPDDIGTIAVRVSGIRSVLDITNVISDTTYVSAQIVNQTTAQVSIGVFDGATVKCVSVLGGASSGSRGFTKTGYYRLLPNTEFRAYRDALHCAGAYLAWGPSQLAAYAPKTGIVNLSLTTAP